MVMRTYHFCNGVRKELLLFMPSGEYDVALILEADEDFLKFNTNSYYSSSLMYPPKFTFCVSDDPKSNVSQ